MWVPVHKVWISYTMKMSRNSQEEKWKHTFFNQDPCAAYMHVGMYTNPKILPK